MSVSGQEVQRLRITYGVSGALVYISVLDSRRLWERMLRRAGLKLSYSQGYHPHPKLYFAAARPVGYHSRGEVVDIILAEAYEPDSVLERIEDAAPAGLTLHKIEQVPVKADKPQSLMRRARYEVEIWSDVSRGALQETIDRLLQRESAPRTRLGRDKAYDLRPLIDEIAYLGSCNNVTQETPPCHRLEMLTRCGSHGSGRPEEIVDEMGIPFEHQRIWRNELIWKES